MRCLKNANFATKIVLPLIEEHKCLIMYCYYNILYKNEKHLEEEERRRKKKEECQITIFFTSRGGYVKFDWKSAVEHDGGV